MLRKSVVSLLGLALFSCIQLSPPALAHIVHLDRHPAVVDLNSPPPSDYGSEAAPGSYPAIGYGNDPRPNGGFAVNPYGYGNYTMGANGGFGGYPPGSDGAKELQEQRTRKCRVVPEQC